MGVVLHNSPGQFSLVLRVPSALIERVSEHIVNLVPVQNTHPVSPWVGTSSLVSKMVRYMKLWQAYMLAYMVKVVIVDLVAMFSILHGKIVAGTDKEEVTNNISNHFLVEVSVIYVFPISILRKK